MFIKPSALNLLNRFISGFSELQQQENDAKRNLLGKILTAAKELTTSTSLTDFMKKLHQQSNEVSAAYYETPPYIREKWASQFIQYQQADQELRDSLDYFKKMMKNPDEYNVLLVGAQFANITFDIGRPYITEEELGSYDYWKSQGLSLDEMKYLAWRLKAPMSDEAFVDLWYGYYEHDAMQKGLHGQANFRTKGSSGGGFVSPPKSIPQSGETTPSKGKRFFRKFSENSQKMGTVSGEGSNWGNKKKNKTGESASESGKVADNETGSGSPPKPAKNASESESTNTSRTPSSKTSETETTTTPKNSTTSKKKPNENESESPPKPAKNSSETEKNNTSRTPSSKTSESDTTKPSTNHTASKNKPNENESESPPKPAKNASESESTNTSRTPSSKTSESDTTTAPKNSTTSKNKNNQDEAPNEVNSWKPKASKNKDEGKPKDDSKPPESSQSDKPMENSNTNKPKEGSEGTEGTGEVKYKEGYYFEHLTGKVEKVTEWKGVSGGHNYEEFRKFFGANEKYSLQEVKKVEHSDIPGIYDLEYRMMVEIKDYTGKGTGKFRYIPKEDKPPYKKTIYDPNIISNDEIIRLGKEAMEEGINSKRVSQLKSQNNKQIIRGVSSNGLKFEGIKNIDTGEIENFYPVLKFGEN
ncbi:CdiA family toxin C-terminal domain-containing protein [Paenibacillus sp. JJ-223]|uniref:CdiA family toxin C-terminal domain-containing protein n=1 Tax=Paenibacillus sp. JJ-223 TaxID=2905647 RepID=UPI001F3B85C1|nr:CdiA family toxin C-terminal domain-containing protein [Paenibacillus sp. JJ-223]CAH1225070.1 hypothetical protein PAECIP111890_05740 [Paenibacillus sp. JJ-223]